MVNDMAPERLSAQNSTRDPRHPSNTTAKPHQRHRKPPQPPTSVHPLPCVILAVDAGRRAGWAIKVAGHFVQFGELDGYHLPSIENVVCAALWRADLEHLPCVLVIERPATYRSSGSNGARGFSTVLGMGATRGVWRAAWESAGGHKRRIVDAPIATWRSKVLGKGYGGGAAATRDVVREVEQAVAKRIAGGVHVGPDASPAVCIATWAERAPQVAKVLPKRRKKVEATHAHSR